MDRTTRLFALAGTVLALSGAAFASDSPDAGRADAAELLADAASRTSQLAQAEGGRRFSVDVHGYFQFRYNWNHRDSQPGLDEENTIGFQMARSRLNISGNIISDDWGYFIQFGANPDGDMFLEDVYGTYRFESGWQAQFGQFKLPFARETLIGDQYLLAADRSISESVFGLSRAQGVQMGYAADAFRFAAAFSDGANTLNSDFNSPDGGMEGGFVADYAFTARAEWKWAGDWSQARDFTSFQNSQFFGMVGIAGHYQSGGDTFAETTGTTIDHDVWAATADVSIEGSGWNIFAAGNIHSFRIRDGFAFFPDERLVDYSFLVQGGIFVTPQTEIFARYDVVMPDSDWDFIDSDEDFTTITLGVNHYFVPESHAAKLTVDFQWFFMESMQSSIVSQDTLRGLLDDASDDQWNLRAQLQLLF
jgi:hypothetical protein